MSCCWPLYSDMFNQASACNRCSYHINHSMDTLEWLTRPRHPNRGSDAMVSGGRQCIRRYRLQATAMVICSNGSKAARDWNSCMKDRLPSFSNRMSERQYALSSSSKWKRSPVVFWCATCSAYHVSNSCRVEGFILSGM